MTFSDADVYQLLREFFPVAFTNLVLCIGIGIYIKSKTKLLSEK